jgi:hypothetical protein
MSKEQQDIDAINASGNRDKDLKIQSDEIIRLNKELKRVTKKASDMEGDNFTLTRAFDLLNKNYGRMVDEIEELRNNKQKDV